MILPSEIFQLFPVDQDAPANALGLEHARRD
jgi:hypothetical protein